jgi:hypothetical protein
MGMKWGKRKQRPMSQDAAKVAKFKSRAKKSGIKSLTNAELQKTNARNELESKFKTSAKRDTSIGKGKIAITSLLAAGVTVNALVNLYQSKAGQGLIQSGKKIVNDLLNKP